ncbi:hypothetical protein ABIA99_002130 [Bradyrhizobium sp. LB12.1]|uniref:hypothetical protein n=1 Tax=Bradyrhizobium sp. LB12.1 TaxID=3156327 RepID=UPI0033933134
MARRPALFKQHDVMRAVRGAIAGGVEIQRVEIGSDGKIVLIAASKNSRTLDDEAAQELEDFMAHHARSQR